MMNRFRIDITVLLMLPALVGGPAGAWASEDVSVRVAVEQQDVYVGDSFVFQIQVNGSDSPAAPDLSGLTDFTVQSLGGQKNNSESVSIINGQMARDVQRGYVFSYRLTPKREGNLMIPAIDVHVGGQTVKTQPIPIRAGKPQENGDFKLRLALSRAKGYVNEPVVLTVTWYISKNVREVGFTLPILDSPAFLAIDSEPPMGSQKKIVQIPLGKTPVIGEAEQEELDGKAYTAIRFQKVLFPRQSGTFTFPPATVSCQALVGLQSGRDSMGGFFGDDFFGMQRGSYKKFVTPSNPLTLEVADLPTKDRPADFSGLVGSYQIEAAAVPVAVNVGDPITLTLKISGPEYLKQVELPPLNRQPDLVREFKIPADMAPGKVEGSTKVFTQTIRALNSGVKQIPAITLSFFDTTAGRYKTVSTKPIPLTVKATKVLTLRDAEGRELTPLQSELKARQEGIAYNYEDLGVLENQDFRPAALIRSPSWLALGIFPPVIYAILCITTVVYRARQSDPAAVKARRAYGELARHVNACLKHNRNEDAGIFGELLEAARNYLGSKLRLSPGALTWRDVESPLRDRGIPTETLLELKGIFDECEARRYAGSKDSSAGPAEIGRRLSAVAGKLERSLK